MEKTAARLVAWMRAWEDYERFPTSDIRRFDLAQRIIEDSCRRLPEPLVLVTDDERESGLPPFGQDGWGFFLVVDVIHGKVRGTIEQLLVIDGRVRVGPGWRGIDGGVPLLEVKPILVDRLRSKVERSRDDGEHQGRGRQWYGKLTETWSGMWRDQSQLILDGFVDPFHGVLWDVMDEQPHWSAPRWAWLAHHNPIRNTTFFADEMVSREAWEWMGAEDLLKLAQQRWLVRKWPDFPKETPVYYERSEIEQALCILMEAATVNYQFEPESIPIKALRDRPKGATIQQRACHYLVRDDAGPKLTTTKAAKLLGITTHHEVARMVRRCEDLRSQ